MTRILIVTDAWAPQVNGVVRSLENLLREAPRLGVDIALLTPETFRTVPLPTYPEVRVALTRPGVIAERIEAAEPDYIHIATEGPLGLCARLACLRSGRPFTTSYHTRFPEYLAARFIAPAGLTYALMRRFHNSGSGVMVATATLERELACARLQAADALVARRRCRAVPAARRARLRPAAADLPHLRAPRGRKEPRRLPFA